jgi:hypothetical protein
MGTARPTPLGIGRCPYTLLTSAPDPPSSHQYPHTDIHRLHRALNNLQPVEALALAFVLGAGLGSILHMIFAITFLAVRRLRCGRKRAIKLEEVVEQDGEVAGREWVDEKAGEVERLPNYEESDEGDKLVVKA